jgi:hypothetical protein
VKILRVCLDREFIGYRITVAEADALIKEFANRRACFHLGEHSHPAIEEYYNHLIKTAAVYQEDISKEDYEAHINGED